MKRLLPIILIVSILLFIWLSWFLPGFVKSVAAKKQQLDAIAQEEKNLPELSNLLASKKDKLEILEKTFPKKEELVAVVQSIDSLAAATGVVAFLHFESEQPVFDEGNNTMLPVTITVQGNFTNCIAFLKRLGQTRYFFDFQTIDGNAKSGIKGENTIVTKGNLYVANK